MFAAIGRFDVRFRWLIVAVWIAGVIAGVRVLPSLSSVTQAGNAQFLSASSPSVQAARLAAPFKRNNPSGTAIIVAHRASGPLTDLDDAAIGRAQQAALRVRWWPSALSRPPLSAAPAVTSGLPREMEVR